MIKSTTPLSMTEAAKYLTKDHTELNSFVKGFVKIAPEKAEELRAKLNELGMIKLNAKHISKIIDLLPVDKNALNHILNDVTLDETESNNVLQIIKEYQ